MSNWGVSVPCGGSVLTGTAETTSGNPAFTFGAWRELVAAVPAGVCSLILSRTTGASVGQMCVQVAVGVQNSEVVIATFTYVVETHTSHVADTMTLPITVPAGQRLAIRTAADAASRSARWRVDFMRGTGLLPIGGSQVELYGFTQATLSGTPITAEPLGVWGTGVEVVASTPRRARAFAICGFDGVVGGTLRGMIGVFYGSSDHLAASPIAAGASSTGSNMAPLSRPSFLMCDIPAGSNLRLRTLTDESTGTPTRDFQLHLVY